MTRKKTKPRPPVKHDGKAFLERAAAAIRKVMRAYDCAPALLDALPRRQREFFLQALVGEPLRVKALDGHHVPRHLLDFIARATQRYLRANLFGDPAIGLTYLELLLHGLPVAYLMLDNYPLPMGMEKITARISEKLDFHKMVQDLIPVGECIRQHTVMLSKMNFRVYDHEWEIVFDFEKKPPVMRAEVRISSENTRPVHFTYKKKERVAFPVRLGQGVNTPARNATIDRWFITGDDDNPPVHLDIYIQSHALQRIKERLDVFPAHKRNYIAMHSLMYMHRVDMLTGEPMIECYVDYRGHPLALGYYPFTIQGNRLIFLTFLPPTSPGTFTGQLLFDNLGLQMEDSRYLGMDKLSFFRVIDFEQIPRLKEMLQESALWTIVEFLAEDPNVTIPVDQKKTMMVKKFFEKKNDVNNRDAYSDFIDVIPIPPKP